MRKVATVRSAKSSGACAAFWNWPKSAACNPSAISRVPEDCPPAPGRRSRPRKAYSVLMSLQPNHSERDVLNPLALLEQRQGLLQDQPLEMRRLLMCRERRFVPEHFIEQELRWVIRATVHHEQFKPGFLARLGCKPRNVRCDFRISLACFPHDSESKLLGVRHGHLLSN